MRTNAAISLALLILGGPAATLADAAPRSGGGVRHLPPADAAPGAPLELVAEVERAWASTLTLHFRPLGAAAWDAADFRRDGDRWIAVIPPAAVQPPGVEYFIDAAADGERLAEFASAARPHPVAVRPTLVDARRARDLAARGGRRSRISAALDLVDLGARADAGGAAVPDRYHRVDADWSYLVLRYPLKAFRIGYSRLLGTIPVDGGGDDRAECEGDRCEVGYKVGGWFELRFAFVEGVELDTRAGAMATADGASLGGRAELRFGVEDASHVAVGGEVLADVGASGFVRLGWGTVPGLPMASTVEVTDYPARDRAAAVRLVYDVFHPFANGLRVGARVGYQARDERVGGLSVGLRTTVDF